MKQKLCLDKHILLNTKHAKWTWNRLARDISSSEATHEVSANISDRRTADESVSKCVPGTQALVVVGGSLEHAREKRALCYVPGRKYHGSTTRHVETWKKILNISNVPIPNGLIKSDSTVQHQAHIQDTRGVPVGQVLVKFLRISEHLMHRRGTGYCPVWQRLIVRCRRFKHGYNRSNPGHIPPIDVLV